MADLLFELFSEEIPARMQRPALSTLQERLAKALEEARLEHGGIRGFVTPRRLAFIVTGLPEAQPDLKIERKGPKADAPEQALQGFLRSTGLSKDQLEVRGEGKAACYFAVIEEKGKPTAEALKPLLEELIAGYTWPKSMRWNDHAESWVRPLQNICCLLDDKVIPVGFGPVAAGNRTYGHRFMAPEAITLKKPSEYEAKLEAAKVIADSGKREAMIAEQMQAAARKLKLEVVEDSALLEEVTGLVEWPVVLVGTIDPDYMDLPPEVLRSEMRNHQKYFNLQQPLPVGEVDADKPKAQTAAGEGKKPSPGSQDSPTSPSGRGVQMADKFLITSNLIASDGGKAIIAGNERVLRARLADGRFYWDQDRKKPLSDWAKGLEDVVFHAKLGHMAYRVIRMTGLAELLTQYVPNGDVKAVHRAAQLAKADLTTGMVGEFPELQGIMGRYYALEQSEAPHIADAIRDHYLPLGPTSPCPTEPTAIAVALADKLDTLAGMFAIGEKPTGSKDPFALRRAALGVIRLILENKLRLPLHRAFLDALEQYLNLEGKTQSNHELADELLQFCLDRLVAMLKGEGMRHDVVAAVLAGNPGDDLTAIMQRVHALNGFLRQKEAQNLLAAYSRANNIVRIEVKKDKQAYDNDPEPGLLQQPEEKTVYEQLGKVAGQIETHLQKEAYEAAFSAAGTLRGPMDAFFDKVTVNADDEKLRRNRLCLLAKVSRELNRLADFEKIEKVA